VLRAASISDRARLAVTRPDLVLRKLRGQDLVAITLDEIARYVPARPVIVEAGAADGQDTASFVRYWPGCQVHAFEPVPSAFAMVEEITAGLAGVRRYQAALSDRVGTTEMYVSADVDTPGCADSSSILAPTGHLTEFPAVTFGQRVTVRTTTLDRWRAECGVDRVDLMWLDMQGAELLALKAGSPTLAVTGAVMMEVSRKELYAGAPLYMEVRAWMRGQGFRPVIDRLALAAGNVLFIREDAGARR
jgi:FkbM family methyltransferase